MHAEIIAIGDELTSGQRIDTNSAWLSDQLEQLGIAVRFHTSVGDDLETTADSFRAALKRADVVISTGGLGPTADDLARESLAKAMGVELRLNQEVLEHIRTIFERRGRTMPNRNERQAMFPIGSQVIRNPNGTAPGIAAEILRAARSSCHVFSLPGVPIEMHQMWADTVQPAIRSLNRDHQVIRHRVLKCFGLGESHLEQRIGDLVERGREPSVGITVHEGTITLRITAHGDSDEVCNGAIGPVENLIRESLGDIVFGVGEVDVAHVVGELLAENNSTLAVVEYGTEGWLTQELATVAGRAGWLRGGLVRPDQRIFAPLFNCRNNPAIDTTTSIEDIASIASVVRAMFAADYALAVGPYFAAEGDAEFDHVHVVLADDTETESETIRLAHHPAVRAADGEQDLAQHAAEEVARKTAIVSITLERDVVPHTECEAYYGTPGTAVPT